MEKGSLSQADLDYISSVIGKKSNDLEYILKNVTKVISDLTDYTSVAITPHAEAERIRNIALLYCGDKKALLVIVTGERILRDSFVDIPEDMTAEDLEGVSKTLCKVFSGRSLSEAKEVEAEVLSEFSQYKELMCEVLDALKMYTKTREGDVVLSGENKIFNHPEYEDVENVKNFISVISSKDRLAEIIGEESDDPQRLLVRDRDLFGGRQEPGNVRRDRPHPDGLYQSDYRAGKRRQSAGRHHQQPQSARKHERK